jgi:hypothetical protein
MDRNSAIVLVQLLATRGIGPRTIDRILDNVSENGTAISNLQGLSSVKLAERYDLDEATAQAFALNEKLAEEIWKKLQEKGVTLLAKERLSIQQSCRPHSARTLHRFFLHRVTLMC